MEDLIREARELKEKVRGMLLTYQYREKILSGEDRDIPADKLYNALVCLGDFASIVEKMVLSTVRADTCIHCTMTGTVSRLPGTGNLLCAWCGCLVDYDTGSVIFRGDPDKKPFPPVTKCPNCQNSNTVSLREGEPDVIECRWCRWAVGRTSQVVLNDGDPSKKMP